MPEMFKSFISTGHPQGDIIALIITTLAAALVVTHIVIFFKRTNRKFCIFHLNLNVIMAGVCILAFAEVLLGAITLGNWTFPVIIIGFFAVFEALGIKKEISVKRFKELKTQS